MPKEKEELPPISLEAAVESILFVATEPVAVSVVASALDVGSKDVESALKTLSGSYAGRGLQIQRIKDKVHLTTSPLAAPVVEKFLGMDHTAGLSRAALETLSVLAYRQPLTRPQIDAVRGVNSESVIDNLITKGLVEETGRADTPGRPILYGTTPAFLQYFGLGSAEELPPLQLDEIASPPEQTDEHEAIASLKG